MTNFDSREFVHRVGQFFNGMAILLAETVTRQPDDPGGGWERRESIVLALIPDNHHTPFVTWVRVISRTLRNDVSQGQVVQYNDVCSWGHYAKTIQEALADYTLRCAAQRDTKERENAIAQRGYDDGWNAAGSLIDGNTPEPEWKLKKLIEGIEDGDPAILDHLPQPRLGGEFADDPTWEDIVRDETDIEELSDDGEHDLMVLYEDNFRHGVEARITKMYESYIEA